MKILALHANSGSRYYRVIPQLKWMQKQGHEVRLIAHDDKYLDQHIAWCDVLVLQMVFSIEIARDARAAGKTVIFECDDLVHKTHALHYSYNETKGFKNQVTWWWRIFRMLRNCDGFIVSTPALKKVYGWFARSTLVFPNYLELEHWMKEPKKNKTDRVRILWAGSTSHTGDLLWVKPIMARIMEKYPKVQFIYLGYGGVPTDDLYARFIYGDDIFEGLPKHRRESMLPAPPNVFPYILASVQADIAIAPLERNYFNKFKSQCKYLEYAINGIPAVYAGWHYTDVKAGLRADSAEEWISALSLLIEDATLRGKIGDEARRVAIEEHNFNDHAHEWQGFVETLHHGKPARTSHIS